MKPNDQRTPALGLVVHGALGVLPNRDEILVCIETGYDGSLLLSEANLKQIGLHLSELPREYWPEGETVTGEAFQLRRALTIAYIPKTGFKLEGYVDTFEGNTENLTGLDFIKTMKLLLDGPSQQTCVT